MGSEPWQQVAASSLLASLAHQRAGAETLLGDQDLDEREREVSPAGWEDLWIGLARENAQMSSFVL